MTDGPVLETERLRLRVPQERDLSGFISLMSDEVAARHIGGVMTEPLIWRQMCAIIGHWVVRGYGFFSVEENATGDWVGRVGPWAPHGWPQREVGWSITRTHWGKGYGPEAAVATMDFAFDELGWDSVIHLIVPENVNSKAVARKLGSVDLGRRAEVPGFGVEAEVWGQSQADWAVNRDRLGR